MAVRIHDLSEAQAAWLDRSVKLHAGVGPDDRATAGVYYVAPDGSTTVETLQVFASLPEEYDGHYDGQAVWLEGDACPVTS